jgi:hypothetical protein
MIFILLGIHTMYIAKRALMLFCIEGNSGTCLPVSWHHITSLSVSTSVQLPAKLHTNCKAE